MISNPMSLVEFGVDSLDPTNVLASLADLLATRGGASAAWAHFVAGDIIRPHLLTTAIGQGSIVAETIDQYLNQVDSKEMKKRPKVDVHHFNLLDKLKELSLIHI